MDNMEIKPFLICLWWLAFNGGVLTIMVLTLEMLRSS